MGTDNGGGSKVPFGMHGEGCDCDEHADVAEPSPQDDAQTTPAEMPDILVSIQQPKNLNELLFAAVAESFSAQLQSLLEQCAFEGEPLSARQIQHVLAALMRGHALAKQSAETIQYQYIKMAMEAMEARKGEEVPPEENASEDPKHSLLDINKLWESSGDQPE